MDNINQFKKAIMLNYFEHISIYYNKAFLNAINNTLFSNKYLEYMINNIIAKDLSIHILEVGEIELDNIKFNSGSEWDRINTNMLSSDCQNKIHDILNTYLKLEHKIVDGVYQLDERYKKEFYSNLNEFIKDFDLNQIKSKAVQIDNYDGYSQINFFTVYYYNLFPLFLINKDLLSNYYFQLQLNQELKSIEPKISVLLAHLNRNSLNKFLFNRLEVSFIDWYKSQDYYKDFKLTENQEQCITNAFQIQKLFQG